MYKPTPIDRNIKKQQWFRKMEWQHKLLLMWIFLDMDEIGIVEPDFEEFYLRFDIIGEGDLDIVEFVNDCNNDRRERMLFLDRGNKLWFNPTVIFRHSSKAGFRNLTDNQRDLAIIRRISDREVTRDWLLQEITYNDRLDISNKLVIKLANDPKSTVSHQEYAKRLAKICKIKIPKGKYSNDAIKERFGCECQYCQKVFDKSDLQIDHVVPQSKKHIDVDKPWNKVPACISCNNLKGSKNVFEFLTAQGFELSEGVRSVVDKWVKRRVLRYPTWYGELKRKNKKEKTFTFSQVTQYVLDNPSVKQSDYECINPEEPVDERRWRRKK